MITVSDEAATLIRTLVEAATLPDTAGLRLGTDDKMHSLDMHLEANPRPGDEVLEHDGVALFVSPLASARLNEQTLDAQVEGRPAFFLT